MLRHQSSLLASVGKGSLLVIDAPFAPGDYTARRAMLGKLSPHNINEAPANDAAYLMPSAIDAMALYSSLSAINDTLHAPLYEGIVAKKSSSLYPRQTIHPEREFPFWVKHRWRF